ncbi:putative 7-carboxy-7-deazaguanine synthase QueE [uncultured Clostridium sp.]|uniref:putative 7-carboxy-7-deazaguanine synthase QueE n=1 Tax=uncultured Clostridium sp. TaxID=59620 RepID=UPI0025CD83C2|nr:putative 7-carboxy-7-deazaguanine synthase QueE [uncultured Clostridium sp.]
MKFKVVEKFVSVNGEGKRAGQLAVFIRFAGCNLECSYCDTKWANDKEVKFELLSADEVYNYIKSTGIKNVTLTGGEPLFQKNIKELLEKLCYDKNLNIEIETNGSINLKEFISIVNRPSFTMDYKCPSSNMEEKMCLSNFEYLDKKDTVKFVVGNIKDLNKVKNIINKYKLIEKTSTYISPVFGSINLESIINFMKENKMNGVNFQIQLHKVIWNPDKRGV